MEVSWTLGQSEAGADATESLGLSWDYSRQYSYLEISREDQDSEFNIQRKYADTWEFKGKRKCADTWEFNVEKMC